MNALSDGVIVVLLQGVLWEEDGEGEKGGTLWDFVGFLGWEGCKYSSLPLCLCCGRGCVYGETKDR
jgi:hypothetical protein